MKKSFYYILSVLVCAVAFVACDDDTTNPYAHTSEISVVESDVYFPAKASTGTITFDAEGAVSAKTKVDWCTATVSGNSVNVSVTNNSSVQNRSTTVTLYCGNDSTNVPVTQAGVLIAVGAGTSITVESDAAQSLSYSFSTNADVNFTSMPDWVTVRTTSDSIYVNMTANTTGHLRSGYIHYTASGLADSIRVFQAEPSDIEGSYYFAGTSASSGNLTYLMANLSYDDGYLTISFPSMGWTMDVEFDPSVPYYFDLPAGTYLGTYGNYYMGIVLWDTVQGYLTWSSSRTYRCTFYYDEEYETTMAEFEDNGSWSGYEVSCIRFEAFSSKTFSSTARQGSVLSLIYPFLQKAD